MEKANNCQFGNDIDDAIRKWNGRPEVKNNAERQRRLRQRRKEAGLVDYRRSVTPEQAKALDELLEKMRLAQ